jgi:hypothetical protein
MNDSRTRNQALAKQASPQAWRRFAGMALFGAGWLLWMHDMASWALSS